MKQAAGKNGNSLDDRRVGRLMIKLTIPAFLGMFVITLYNVVDTIFVGRYVGAMGIAGLSIVFPLQMLCLGIGQLVGLGGASLISLRIGAGDTAGAEHALGNSFSLVALFSGLITIAGLGAMNFWLRVLGASDTVLPYAGAYMRIILFGVFFQTFAMAVTGLVRAEGNAKIPVISMSIGAISNIILDALFIIKFGMGIQGAALATVIGQGLSVIYLVSYYEGGKSYLGLHARFLRLKAEIVKPILSIGSASFARMLATSVSAVIVNNTLMRYGTDYSVAAFGILNRILMFALLPGIAIGQGLQPVLGFNYGARRYGLALRSVKLAAVSSTAFCVAVFFLIHFQPEPMARIFTHDARIIALTAHAARIAFFNVYLIGFIMVGSLTFQAIGKAGHSMLTAISRPVLFLIPLLLILPRFWSVNGVWLSFPIADALTFLLTLALFIPQVREMKRQSAGAKPA
jgi:putative MATE family efflux protein